MVRAPNFEPSRADRGDAQFQHLNLVIQFLAILLMGVTAALHIYLQTLPRFGSNTVRGAMKGTGGGSAAVFVVCAAVVWPVGTLLGYHIRVSWSSILFHSCIPVPFRYFILVRVVDDDR